MTFISSSSILLSTLLLSVQKKNFSYCFASPRKWKKKKERNGGRWLWSSISNTWFNHKCAPKVKRASFAFEQIILSLKAFRHCQMNDSWYRILLLLLSLAHKLSQREELIEGKKKIKNNMFIFIRDLSLSITSRLLFLISSFISLCNDTAEFFEMYSSICKSNNSSWKIMKHEILIRGILIHEKYLLKC